MSGQAPVKKNICKQRNNQDRRHVNAKGMAYRKAKTSKKKKKKKPAARARLS